MKKYFLFVLMAAIVPNFCFGVSARYTQLVREKQRKMEELEKCMGAQKGLKIAGVSTLGLTAVGVAGNIYEASAIKKYDSEIESADKAIEKTQKDIDKLSCIEDMIKRDANAVSASKHNGICKITECKKGFEPSQSGQFCERKDYDCEADNTLCISCYSDGGIWNDKTESCDCKGGRVWYKDKAVCDFATDSEIIAMDKNNCDGKWNDKTQSCDCWQPLVWSKTYHQCIEISMLDLNELTQQQCESRQNAGENIKWSTNGCVSLDENGCAPGDEKCARDKAEIKKQEQQEKQKKCSDSYGKWTDDGGCDCKDNFLLNGECVSLNQYKCFNLGGDWNNDDCYGIDFEKLDDEDACWWEGGIWDRGRCICPLGQDINPETRKCEITDTGTSVKELNVKKISVPDNIKIKMPEPVNDPYRYARNRCDTYNGVWDDDDNTCECPDAIPYWDPNTNRCIESPVINQNQGPIGIIATQTEQEEPEPLSERRSSVLLLNQSAGNK